jgi:branched-chain amino acid aminotransferase
MSRVFVNGVEGAGLPADDLGFTRGMNVFETLRTYGRSPFRIDQHLKRLEDSAKAMEVPLASLEEVREEILEYVEADVWMRITLTAGHNRVLHVHPVEAAKVGRPVRVASVQMTPMPWLPGSVKHGSRAAWVLAARARGVDEVVFTTPSGHVLEANRSNIFAVVGGVVRTPPNDGEKLEGVTRGALVEAALRAGLPFDDSPLALHTDFEELYLSSTLKELAPVETIDDRSVGGGPVGAALHEAFRALVAEECGG